MKLDRNMKKKKKEWIRKGINKRGLIRIYRSNLDQLLYISQQENIQTENNDIELVVEFLINNYMKLPEGVHSHENRRKRTDSIEK